MEIVGDLPPPVVNVVNGAGGNWRVSGDLETHRQSGVYRLNGSGPTNYAIRHAKHYSGDAGAGRQIAKYLFADVMDKKMPFSIKRWKGFALLPPLTGRSLHLSKPCFMGVYLRTLYGTRHPPCRKHSQR